MLWSNDILILPYFKIGERLVFFMKIVCKQPKMTKLPCRQQKGLTYRFEIYQLPLKFSGNNIGTHDIRLLIKYSGTLH